MTATHRFNQSESSTRRACDLRSALRKRLLSLNFHAFAQVVAIMLEKAGYEDVHLAGRVHYRGTNGKGVPAGYDLSATARSGPASPSRQIVVRAKQFDAQPIFQKVVDELRGVCLRSGASEALLITTGPIAASVAERLSRTPDAQVAPVRIIDGERLLDLLIEHRIGVWEEVSLPFDPPRVEIDTNFFADLARTRVGNGPGDCTAGPKYLVTVDVTPLRQKRGGSRASAFGSDKGDHSSRLTLFAR